jgi:hypothetical protein
MQTAIRAGTIHLEKQDTKYGSHMYGFDLKHVWKWCVITRIQRKHLHMLRQRPSCGGISQCNFMVGARGSVVFKALGYKPEGRGFETRLGEQIF